MTVSPKVLGDLLGGGDGQRVDDAASVELAEVLAEPGEPLLGPLELQHREMQRLPVERASEHEHIGSELIGHVLR